MATVHIVDGDGAVRGDLARLLKSAGYSVRAYASVAEVLIESIQPARLQPGCFVMDMHVPELGGLELQRVLSGWPEPPPVVFLSAHADVATAVQAMRGGAVDVLIRPASDACLLASVARAVEDDRAARLERARLRRHRERFEALSERDRAVFAGVIRGVINREIARHLHIAERTVKAHRAHVMQTMQAATLPDLVRIGAQLGLAVGRAGAAP